MCISIPANMQRKLACRSGRVLDLASLRCVAMMCITPELLWQPGLEHRYQAGHARIAADLRRLQRCDKLCMDGCSKRLCERTTLIRFTSFGT